MEQPRIPLSAQPDVLDQMLDQVLLGMDAVLEGDAAACGTLLDLAALALADRGTRVLRASSAAPGGLTLSGLMAQVVGQPDLTAQDDAVLERGFQALTVPGAGYSQVALLVAGADALALAALRYLQFVTRPAPALRMVFAGPPGLLDRLAADEFAALRGRLASRPALRAVVPVVLPALVVPARPARTRHGVAWAGIGLGMAASVLAGVWIGQHSAAPLRPVMAGHVPSPLADPAPQPLLVPVPAPARTEPSAAPAAGRATAAQPEAPLPVPAPAKDATPLEQAELQHAEALSMPPLPVPHEAVRPAPHPASINRRTTVLSRAATAPRPAEPARSSSPVDPYLRAPPGEWVHWTPYLSSYQAMERPHGYVGTYATDAYGMRTFRAGP